MDGATFIQGLTQKLEHILREHDDVPADTRREIREVIDRLARIQPDSDQSWRPTSPDQISPEQMASLNEDDSPF